jgi:hypothetical protein
VWKLKLRRRLQGPILGGSGCEDADVVGRQESQARDDLLKAPAWVNEYSAIGLTLRRRRDDVLTELEMFVLGTEPDDLVPD